MTSDDRVIDDISKKIDRERILIQGTRALRNSTTNVSVQQKCDTNIHESEKNIEYLQERMKQLQIRKRSSVSAEASNNPQSNATSPYNTTSANSTKNALPSMFLLLLSDPDDLLY